MDYLTKSVSRKTLRKYSMILRELFDVNEHEPFPVLEALEKVPKVFKGCDYIVVEDSKLSKNTPARCVVTDGGYLIEIKNSVYMGAYEKKIGAYMGFICHEICHIFLFKIGYTPIFERSFKENELRPFESVEWQAKALCGEVMMPYDDTSKMRVQEIMDAYHVSKGFAKNRKKY